MVALPEHLHLKSPEIIPVRSKTCCSLMMQWGGRGNNTLNSTAMKKIFSLFLSFLLLFIATSAHANGGIDSTRIYFQQSITELKKLLEKHSELQNVSPMFHHDEQNKHN